MADSLDKQRKFLIKIKFNCAANAASDMMDEALHYWVHAVIFARLQDTILTPTPLIICCDHSRENEHETRICMISA